MNHPLQCVVGPLRYACQRDFARLSTVKDLRSVLTRALASAEGLAPGPLAQMREALPEVDHPGSETRKAALRRLLAGLSLSGLALPAELSCLIPERGGLLEPALREDGPSAAVRRGTAAALSDERTRVAPVVRAASSALATQRASAASGLRGGLSAVSPAPGAPSAAVPAKPVRAAKKAKGKKSARKAEGASGAEATLLSIAPRQGPLAALLKDAGKRIGPQLLSAMYRRGMRRVGDVLFFLPRGYEDRRKLQRIADLQPGTRGVTVGVVKSAGEVPTREGKRYFRAVVADASGSLAATYFLSGAWLKARFPLGKRLVLSGEVRASLTGREMPHPEIEPAEDLESSSVHFGRIVPVYPGFERGAQRAFRDLAFRVSQAHAEALEEPLPEELRARLGLLRLPQALRSIHFPSAETDLDGLNAHESEAHRRLAFDEFFFLQLGMGLKRQGLKTQVGIAFNAEPARLERALAALPFVLTGAQTRVVGEVTEDMARSEPMNRLVQGDVGSGKTAVAAVAALLALQDGYQVAVMAPTEILAEQLARNFRTWLAPQGFNTALISAAGTAKQKREARDAVARGEVHLAVGTHALIQGSVSFARLGLVVIDEQHRFGVLQRQDLMIKGLRPDVLVMTATPIPRTLAMTLYGDLDVSIIDALPPGRTPISTRVLSDKQRSKVQAAVAEELKAGRQAYVVYPLVEESETLDLEDATQGLEKWRQALPGVSVGMLHGRMKAEEKDAAMNAFRAGEVQLLVCTTVVEVGVDVPNASVMVIESAERFGLSQLHQLRGRVGRGAAASFCYLVAGFARSQESSERLAVMERSSDGFVIAEKDLEIRGPGEFLGTRQSGLPELAVANLVRDGDLLNMAQREARRILQKDPSLQRPEHHALVRALEERWEGRLALARVA